MLFTLVFEIIWGLYKSPDFLARKRFFFFVLLLLSIERFSAKDRNMRAVIKIVLLAFLSIALLTVVGCSQKKSSNALSHWMQDSEKVKVLSTIAQIGDLVKEIGGERIDTWVLVTGDLDPHSYALVKGDDEKFARADLIFYNGLGLEHGAGLSAQLRENKNAVALGEEIRKIAPEEILQKEGVIDPHVWMDISLWQKGVRIVVNRLIEIDPEGSAYYKERAERLTEEMDKVHADVLSQMMKIPSSKRFLATSHDAFRYFSRAYLADPGESNWQRRFEAPEGLSPDGQLNPIDIQRTINFLKEHKISVVFPESNISQDALAKVAAASRELGMEVYVSSQPLYGDAMGGLSYFEMMKSNAAVLSQQLGGADYVCN